MAIIRAIRKRGKGGKATPAEKNLIAQFLIELERDVDEEACTPMTKGQALAKKMIDGALEGDARMLANILKLIDKMDRVKEEPAVNVPRPRAEDWEMALAFYGKYKTLIEEEIERLRQIDPSYWSFDWFRPASETAPWRAALQDEDSV